MEKQADLKSILQLLPLVIRSSHLFWPSQAVESLNQLCHTKLHSGESFFSAIIGIRDSLSLSHQCLAPFSQQGYSLFFDELISRAESTTWFQEVLPTLAKLLLRLPALLESHYKNSHDLLLGGLQTALRVLGPQEPGIVFLSQELIGALLACALFCLFPRADRALKDLPIINFDHLFHDLYESYSESQESKIKCIIHYFERISSCMPTGYVSFERKVLLFEPISSRISYPEPDFWSKSAIPLCPFQVNSSGFIEDQSNAALEVDFANRYLGGGALTRGCVQEEIRFMINPELIVGMLFLPSMEDNEAIEIVGAERFSTYKGYASSFRFSGDLIDKKSIDSFRRRKGRIIAMDALCRPRMRQYRLECLLRETNKAFCGFFDQSKCNHYERLFPEKGLEGVFCEDDISKNKFWEMHDGESMQQEIRYSEKHSHWCIDHEDEIGIATGNWGCGAFGGDPELKAIIQWLAASQALRPFILYYTCGIEALHNLNQVSRWILSHGWTVGDLWNMLVEYSSHRLNGETNVGFLKWLLPSPSLREKDKSTGPNTP